MIRIDPKTTAVVAIDMHRGHLDPSVATLPLPAESCRRVIGAGRELFHTLRTRGIPVVHVVTSYRDPSESLSNPFWKAIAEDPNMRRSGASRHNMAASPGTLSTSHAESFFVIVISTSREMPLRIVSGNVTSSFAGLSFLS